MADLTHDSAAIGATPKTTPPPKPSCALLALDLGTTTGWALRGHDGLITSGTVSFRPGRFDGGGMRYLRFTNWLTELDRLSGPIAAIWFEEVRRHAGTDAAHVFGGLMASLTSWAELRGIPYQGVPVGTIKRHATGKGNANKQAMIAAAQPAYRPRSTRAHSTARGPHWTRHQDNPHSPTTGATRPLRRTRPEKTKLKPPRCGKNRCPT